MNREQRLSASERAQAERLETFYVQAQSDVMRAIERRVFGSDYGGCSWTTRAEASWMARALELRPGRRLLDLGAGSGWPGLLMADESGCDVVLADLPLTGLRIALDRATLDGLAGRCWAAVADGGALPFVDGCFDAISHSDVLCCLLAKRAVLMECRRLLGAHGTMIFSVILVAPGLSDADRRRAVECGPEFIELDTDYPTLLADTGWSLRRTRDVTAQFARSSRRVHEAQASHAEALRKLLGPDLYAERKSYWERRHLGATAGLLKREIFVATPNSR